MGLWLPQNSFKHRSSFPTLRRGAAATRRLRASVTRSPSWHRASRLPPNELLVLIREFDEREGWGGGFKSCAHWLNWRTGLAMGAAREKVRVARALVGLIQFRGRFPKGGYDVHDGKHNEAETTTSSVHTGVPGRCRAAGAR